MTSETAAPDSALDPAGDAPPEPGPGPRIAIVGLGDMGIALGRALAAVRTSYALAGHDPDPDRVGAARGAGVFDRLDWNLARAVDGADLVFLTEPADAALATLAAIGPRLAAGALVTDTAPVKEPILAAAQGLPPGVGFVGGHPVVDAAAAALDPAAFRGATYCLMPAPGAPEHALRVLGDFVRAIGAEPYFIDAAEHDALMAGCEVLPGLVADALLRVVALGPSADDVRRLAGPALRLLAARDAADPMAVEAARPAAIAWLDRLAEDLAAARAALADDDPAARGALAERAAEARARWLADREPPQAVAAREALADRPGIRDLFFGRLGRRRA